MQAPSNYQCLYLRDNCRNVFCRAAVLLRRRERAPRWDGRSQDYAAARRALAGYLGPRFSEGVLDDLYAEAVVFDDGKTKVAMVTCDLIGLPRPVVVEARRIITDETGIPADNVMISATHTHTGPTVLGLSVIGDLTAAGNKLSRDYSEQLPKSIARAVRQAAGRLTPARIAYGSVNEPDISFVRRFWMKDGSMGWNPGKLNPNILRPIGTVDPQVHVVYAETPDSKRNRVQDQVAPDGSHRNAASDSKPLLTYVNFGMHPDAIGGALVSADFPALFPAARRIQGSRDADDVRQRRLWKRRHLNVNWAGGQTGPQEAGGWAQSLPAT